MRILLVCGCLEPGKDGVGDYARALAQALMRNGHEVIGVSLHDRYSDRGGSARSELRPAQDHGVAVIRLSPSWSWRVRLRALRRFCLNWQPDWISLHYVPYSFSHKGVPVLFTASLGILRGPWLWHIMFHELWIVRTDLKSWLISLSQQGLIARACASLAPRVVHTSLVSYRQMLSRLGVDADLLPLHGNIPPLAVAPSEPSAGECWTFVFFGYLDVFFEPLAFFALVERARIMAQKQGCRFVCLGRLRGRGEALWAAIASAEAQQRYPCFMFERLGELSADAVSAVLLSASFGISMAPFQWVGKSGSVAAMIDHGLPVIVPVLDAVCPRDVAIGHALPSQLLPMDERLPERLCQATRFPVRQTVDANARRLADSFRASG